MTRSGEIARGRGARRYPASRATAQERAQTSVGLSYTPKPSLGSETGDDADAADEASATVDWSVKEDMKVLEGGGLR